MKRRATSTASSADFTWIRAEAGDQLLGLGEGTVGHLKSDPTSLTCVPLVGFAAPVISSTPDFDISWLNTPI